MQQGSRARAGGCFLTSFLLLGFFFGDRGVASAAVEIPFRVGLFTRASLGA